jgi:hypothetical protein
MNPFKKQDKEESLALVNKIKEADKGILILSKKGHIEVMGVKNINYSVEAMGLLQGALNVYATRDITRLLGNQLQQILILMEQIKTQIVSKDVKKDEKKKQ